MRKKKVNLRTLLAFFTISTLPACAMLGVPGEYKSWSTTDIELSPYKALAIENQANPTGPAPTFLTSKGALLPELVFDLYTWGYSYTLKVRQWTTVHKGHDSDRPQREIRLVSEGVLQKNPVNKGDCKTVPLSTSNEQIDPGRFSDYFLPNLIVLKANSETQLRTLARNTDYEVTICFNQVPKMVIDIVSILPARNCKE